MYIIARQILSVGSNDTIALQLQKFRTIICSRKLESCFQRWKAVNACQHQPSEKESFEVLPEETERPRPASNAHIVESETDAAHDRMSGCNDRKQGESRWPWDASKASWWGETETSHPQAGEILHTWRKSVGYEIGGHKQQTYSKNEIGQSENHNSSICLLVPVVSSHWQVVVVCVFKCPVQRSIHWRPYFIFDHMLHRWVKPAKSKRVLQHDFVEDLCWILYWEHLICLRQWSQSHQIRIRRRVGQ